MAYIKYNANPHDKETGDCVVRAISIAEGKTWDDIFKELTTEAYHKKDMPSMNPLWVEYLEDKGYSLYGLKNYTVNTFTYDNPYGTYVLGTGSHAVAVIDGNYIDTWNSGNEQVMYALKKGDNSNDELLSTTVQQPSGSPTVQPATADNTSASAATAQPEPATVSGSVLGTGTGGSQGVPAANS